MCHYSFIDRAAIRRQGRPMMRILVIDDEEMLRDNLADILELEGYEVLKAENGAMGVQVARNMLPDLILCDVTMPMLDGYGVAQELQKDSATASIPLLVLTAKLDDSSVHRATELGVTGYLTKPFFPRELLSAIHVMLKNKRSAMDTDD
jgi:diguanylate cyclase